MLSTTVNVDDLIETFTSMSKRKSLLTKDELQEDLLIQIIGTILKVSMDTEKKIDRVSVTKSLPPTDTTYVNSATINNY